MEMKAVTMVVKMIPESLLRGEILDQSGSQNEDRDGGGVPSCEQPSPLRSSVFMYIWRGTSKTEDETVPEVRFELAHAARYRGHVGPPLLALVHPLVSILCTLSSFSIKIDVVFSLILFPAKIDREKTLLKTASYSLVLFKYGKIPEQIVRQSAWKIRSTLGASTPPSLARCLSSNNSNVVQKR